VRDADEPAELGPRDTGGDTDTHGFAALLRGSDPGDLVDGLHLGDYDRTATALTPSGPNPCKPTGRHLRKVLTRRYVIVLTHLSLILYSWGMPPRTRRKPRKERFLILGDGPKLYESQDWTDAPASGEAIWRRHGRADVVESWPLPPRALVRVFDRELGYVVDVELYMENPDEAVVSGLCVRRPVPLTKRKSGPPRWPDGIEVPSLSFRDLDRLPLETIIEAAVAHMTYRPTSPTAAQRRSRYWRVGEIYRRAKQSGRSAAVEIAAELGISQNAAHQLIHRVRKDPSITAHFPELIASTGKARSTFARRGRAT
jgi:hypothetical protein